MKLSSPFFSMPVETSILFCEVGFGLIQNAMPPNIVIVVLMAVSVSYGNCEEPNFKQTAALMRFIGESYPYYKNALYSGINYTQVYGLRFDPVRLSKNSKRNLFNGFGNSEETQEGTTNTIKQTQVESSSIQNEENPLPEKANTSIIAESGIQDVSVLMEQPYNISHILNSDFFMNPSAGSTKVSDKQSNKINSTLHTLANRFKTLFFSSPTMWRKPQNTQINSSMSSGTGKGFLNLIDVIKFENIPCSGSQKPLRLQHGTCYHRFECTSLGGVPIGLCAGGYGVCCVFKYSCGERTTQENSYFENPRYPLSCSETTACSFSIEIRKNVQQIRLDLLNFELQSPTDGNCINDQFVVMGQSVNFHVPIICGINSGQHLYVDVQNSQDGTLSLTVFGRTKAERVFSIRVVQLSDTLAPEGCLQYFTESEGRLKSFNYDRIGNFITSERPMYFNNLNYAICIKRGPFCNITYTNTNDLFAAQYPPFQLINIDNDQISLVPSEQAGGEIFNCPHDFIVVNGIRLCGERLNDASAIDDFTLNAPVTEIGMGPIVIPFRTNENTVGRGFNLFYKLNLC